MNGFLKRRLFHAKAGAKGGKRFGVYFRSSWEFNCSLWLSELKRMGEILDWKYEDTEFEFKSIKRGTRFYKPDFHCLTETGEYFIEVKGHLDPKSVTMLTRMARHYPDVTVLLLDKKKYAEICSEFGYLPNWEN